MKAPFGLSSAIGKKIVMAVTGLAMCLFLVGHLVGNLQLLWNLDQFNAYASFLTAQPVVIVIELGLLAILLLHVFDAIVLLKTNYAARPVPYHTKSWGRTKSNRSRKTWASTFMMWSGMAMLFFITFHVWHFKFHNPITKAGQSVEQHSPNVVVGVADGGVGTANATSQAGGGKEALKLAELVVTEFQNPFVSAIYIVSMLLLGMHLYHAVSSAFTSLGASHPRYVKGILFFGRAFTIIVCGGFAIIPILVLMGLIKLPDPELPKTAERPALVK